MERPVATIDAHPPIRIILLSLTVPANGRAAATAVHEVLLCCPLRWTNDRGGLHSDDKEIDQVRAKSTTTGQNAAARYKCRTQLIYGNLRQLMAGACVDSRGLGGGGGADWVDGGLVPGSAGANQGGRSALVLITFVDSYYCIVMIPVCMQTGVGVGVIQHTRI